MSENFKKESYVKCVVSSCSKRKSPGISLHKFPNSETNQSLFEEWCRALQLKSKPSSFAKVCSEHFDVSDFHLVKSSDQRKLILKSGVVPKLTKQVVEIVENNCITDQQDHISQANLTLLAEAAISHTSQDVTYEEDSVSNTRCAQKKDAEIQVNTEDIDNLFKKKIRKIVSIQTEEQLTAWTGLKHFRVIDVITRALQMVPESSLFSKWDISLRNLVMLVLIKLKTNLSFRCISSMFDIRPKTASHYFIDTVPILADVMRIAVPWPNTELIANDLPYHFAKYRDVRAVLDCTEVPIQRSSYLHCRILTYSHYKGKETAKYLVAVTPGGCFSYISPGYGGKASDKFIFNACGMVSLFQEKDAVMVDKGFAIANELAEYNLQLIRPPILSNEQLTAEEASQNVSIAAARVHVERAIQRLKNFSITTDKVESSLLFLLDDILIILAGAVNLSAPILSDDRFTSN